MTCGLRVSFLGNDVRCLPLSVMVGVILWVYDTRMLDRDRGFWNIGLCVLPLFRSFWPCVFFLFLCVFFPSLDYFLFVLYFEMLFFVLCPFECCTRHESKASWRRWRRRRPTCTVMRSLWRPRVSTSSRRSAARRIGGWVDVGEGVGGDIVMW